MSKLLTLSSHLPKRIQSWFIQQWYEFLSRLDTDTNMVFMNYGWANLDPEAPALALQPQDEANRYCIQLYNRVAGAIDLRGLDVLEVGSGRGGGASFVKRYLEPKLLIGLDFAAQAVAFCRQQHTTPGLTFRQGRAEALPFEDETFDAVVNVESSHNYVSMEQFLSGVYRVLKPGGFFLYTDLRIQKELGLLRQRLKNSGLTLRHEETINANVVHALEMDNDRKQALIEKKVPRFLHRFFRNFAGMIGTDLAYSVLKNEEKIYLRVVMQK